MYRSLVSISNFILASIIEVGCVHNSLLLSTFNIANISENSHDKIGAMTRSQLRTETIMTNLFYRYE
jgi:tRNA A37 threonylcarbamoyladenosine dehydratase